MTEGHDWAMLAARQMVEAHINSWGMVPSPDFLKDMIAAGLRAAHNGSLGPANARRHQPTDD